jgi:hypothetical protein
VDQESRAKRLREELDRVHDVTHPTNDRAITTSRLSEILRRGAEPLGLDGYPAGSSDGGHGSGDGDPTLAVIAARAGGREADEVTGEEATPDTWPSHPDPIGDMIAEAVTSISKLYKLARRIDVLMVCIERAHEARRGRQVTVAACAACQRDVACTTADPLRGGFCSACDTAWRRFRNGHHETSDPGAMRRAFIEHRRAAATQ